MCHSRSHHGPVRIQRDLQAEELSHHPDLRASDAEREAVAVRLREHGAAGRLDVDELEERVGAAYAARTRGELARLFHDLPRLTTQVRVAAPSPAPARRRSGDDLRVFAGVSLLLVAIWLFAGAGYFWPFWVLVWWGAALAVKRPLRHRAGGGGFGTSTGVG